MRASDQSLEMIFKSYDKDGGGDISNLEFKQAFRKLGIGLTSKEIDTLVNTCDESGDGCVNWHEFSKKFTHKYFFHWNFIIFSEIADRLLSRCQNRLQKLNDDLHYYMLSPKDAFR